MAETLDKTRRFGWTPKRVRAALLLGEDERSDAEIADGLGISRSTLSNWKTRPEFTERVARHVAELDAAVSRYRIAKRRTRVRILDDLQSGLLTVIQERAERGGEAPGASTGHLALQEKQFGTGKNAQIVKEYQVDTGVIHEIRALQKQAAQDLGQWSEKSQIDVSGGIRREYVVITEHDTTPITPEELEGLDTLDEDPG